MTMRRTTSHADLRTKETSEGRPVLRFFCSFCYYGLITMMFVVLTGPGCLTLKVGEQPTSLKKSTAPKSGEICDPEADKAWALQDYQNSIRLHERFLQKEPGNRLALYHLGYAYGEIGRFEKEAYYYEQAIARGLIEDHIFFNLGMAYGELNQPEKAALAFQKGLKINPASSDNYFGLALIYQKSGADKSAEEAFLEAIKTNPGHLEARLYLSLLYADMGDLQKAADQLRKILEIDPSHKDARELLEKIEKE